MDNVVKPALAKTARDLVEAALFIKRENDELRVTVEQLTRCLQESEEDLFESEANLNFAERTIGELCNELIKSDQERRVAPFYV